MAKTYLPPQAYTREDVAKAYVWVQSQPDYVKNMATSKEALVALYLQARRNGISSLENMAPVSSRDFKSQLQTLATELNQFEKPKEPLKASPIPQAPVIPTAPPEFESEISHDFESSVNPNQRYDERSIEVKVSERRYESDSLTLDPKSQQIIESVKAAFNMESDREVVRMLISLGYDKLKSILPQK